MHDHSLLGAGLVDFIRNQVMIPSPTGGQSTSGVKVLFITDGGESCNREGRTGQNNSTSLFCQLLDSNLDPTRLMLTIVGFGVSDQQSVNRLNNLINTAQTRGARFARLRITNQTTFGLAQNELTQELNQFMGEMTSTRYNPCFSCDTTRRQACDCCYYGNFWRWACPFPECYPTNWVPEFICNAGGWQTYQDASGRTVTVCMSGYWVFCPDPEHSATVYCGDFGHTCGPWVRTHGECPLSPCQYCSQFLGSQHNYFDGFPSCAGVACPPANPPHPQAPLANIANTWRRPCADPGRISTPFPLTIEPEPPH